MMMDAKQCLNLGVGLCANDHKIWVKSNGWPYHTITHTHHYTHTHTQNNGDH